MNSPTQSPFRRVLGRLGRGPAHPAVPPPEPAAVLSTLFPGFVTAALVGSPTVALIAGAESGPVARDADQVLAELGEVAPDARVRRFDPATDPGDLHLELAATGPYDAIVDVAADDVGRRVERARAVLLHLRKGGVLVVAGARVDEPVADGPDFATLVADALTAALRGPVRVRRKADDRSSWGRAVGQVSARKRHLFIATGISARAKIREEQARRYLELVGPERGRILAERPGSVLVNPAPVRESQADGGPTIATRFEAPPLQLREYANVVCREGQVVTQRNVLLPETYRHLARRRLGNRYVEDVAPAFGRVLDRTPPEPLAGTFFHLDSEFRGHFGHATTEQISRLWAWEEAKQLVPDLKALLIVNKTRTEIYDWERRLYQAAGVDPDDLVLVDGPVRVERLLSATPAFSQPQYVHTEAARIYQRIGDDLAAEAPDRDYPERFFCSRRNTKRSCHNTVEVEEFFAARGFEIVYPEDYPLGEQVQMFRSAREVAGFGGSAMFTIAFAPEPMRVTLVSSENYWAQNEYLLAATAGHQVNVAWCRPDKPRAQGFRGEQALQSQFTFDPEREGQFLREVLGG